MGKIGLDPRIVEFSRLIGEKRKEKNLSYEQLGRLANIHRTTLSLIERQKYNPSLQMCLRIADALEISLPDALRKAELKAIKYSKSTSKK